MTVRMRAEFVGPLGRHGRDFQTIEPRLRIVLCVYNVQKIEKPAACEMRSIIRFMNVRNIKQADIRHELCEVYGKLA
jgi:hypothetical protein